MQKDDIKEDIESNSSDSSDQKISFTDFDHKKIDSKFFFRADTNLWNNN